MADNAAHYVCSNGSLNSKVEAPTMGFLCNQPGALRFPIQENSFAVIFHLLDCAVLFIERQFIDIGKDVSEP